MMKKFVLLLSGLFLSLLAFTSPSSAFDCSKAATPTETAICASPDLKIADEAMSKSYFEIRSGANAKMKSDLKKVQRHWLNFRNKKCVAVHDCLKTEMQYWAKLLSELKPGMVPVFIWQKGQGTVYGVQVTGAKFSTPATLAQSTYNQEFDRYIADAPFNEVVEGGAAYSPEHELESSIIRLNDRLLSASFNNINFSGAHPSYWQEAINIDAKSGKVLVSTDVFSPNAIAQLIRQCRDQIIKDKYEATDAQMAQKRIQIEEEYPNAVRGHILDMKQWTFGPDGATIWFDKYDIGPYTEVPYQCEFSDAQITSLANDPELIAK